MLRVVVDGGYSNGTLVRNRPANVHITGKVRKDAVLYEPVAPPNGSVRRGRPRQKGIELPKPIQMCDYTLTDWDAVFIELYGKETILLVRQFHAIRYRVGGNEVLPIVLVRDPNGDYPDTVLFDTNINSTDTEMIKRFSQRWSIKITNRETKHFLGSTDPQCRCENSVSRAPLMAYWCYCLVVLWFVDQFKKRKGLPFPKNSLVSQEEYLLLGHACSCKAQPSLPRSFDRTQHGAGQPEIHLRALSAPT